MSKLVIARFLDLNVNEVVISVENDIIHLEMNGTDIQFTESYWDNPGNCQGIGSICLIVEALQKAEHTVVNRKRRTKS